MSCLLLKVEKKKWKDNEDEEEVEARSTLYPPWHYVQGL